MPPPSGAAIEASRLTVALGRDRCRIEVLSGLTMSVAFGECVALVGPSGCGKSTLLSLISGLRRPCSGRVEVLGHDLTGSSDADLARLRGAHIGLVYQAFHLLPHLSARDNVALAAQIAGHSRPAARHAAAGALAAVGLAGRTTHRPSELSGGEQQRVAIARALVNGPRLLLADEPTGNLDALTTEGVARLIVDVRNTGRAVVIATHDPAVAALADRIVDLTRVG